MAKSVHDDVLDGALNIVKNNASKMIACSSEPTTYTQANSTYKLAEIAVAPTDFSLADGATSGRKLTVAQKSGSTVATSGTATHVALVDTTLNRLLYVTTATNQVLTAGNSLTFQSWAVEIADPA